MKLAVWAAAAVLLGCSSDKRAGAVSEPEPESESVAESEPEPESESESESAGPIPAQSGQLLVAIVEDWDAVPARLQRYEREQGGPWQAVGQPWQAVIGVRGSGWGVGLHGAGPVEGREGPTKVEGDGKSPAGVFALGSAYGYAAAAPEGARIDYQMVDRQWRCIDDPSSAHYNRVLDRRQVSQDWTSAETMRRSDDLYRWVIWVDHNPEAVPGAGSCIFLHVWGGKSRGSAGCTAMAEDRARSLLSWLDPAQSPVFVLLPEADYSDLTALWALPPAL